LRLRLGTELPVTFLKYYIGRRHVTGGVMGFIVTSIIAYYRWMRVVRMYRYQRSSAALGAVADQLRP
jgi:hypothetical protein